MYGCANVDYQVQGTSTGTQTYDHQVEFKSKDPEIVDEKCNDSFCPKPADPNTSRCRNVDNLV